MNGRINLKIKYNVKSYSKVQKIKKKQRKNELKHNNNNNNNNSNKNTNNDINHKNNVGRYFVIEIQKQAFASVLDKTCRKIFQKRYRKCLW